MTVYGAIAVVADKQKLQGIGLNLFSVIYAKAVTFVRLVENIV
jgi:hypothetical protein